MKQIFQQMVLGHLNIHVKNSETATLLYAIYKLSFKMVYTPKFKSKTGCGPMMEEE